jgi:hypothetical protein
LLSLPLLLLLLLLLFAVLQVLPSHFLFLYALTRARPHPCF